MFDSDTRFGGNLGAPVRATPVSRRGRARGCQKQAFLAPWFVQTLGPPAPKTAAQALAGDVAWETFERLWLYHKGMEQRTAASTPSPIWQIQLFCGLRAIREERTVTRFRTQKTAALLAYLAYQAIFAQPPPV